MKGLLQSDFLTDSVDVLRLLITLVVVIPALHMTPVLVPWHELSSVAQLVAKPAESAPNFYWLILRPQCV